MMITAEERLMYQVMKAIYDSGIPISFKGSMVLNDCFRNTIRIFSMSETRLIPDLYHIIQHLLILLNILVLL